MKLLHRNCRLVFLIVRLSWYPEKEWFLLIAATCVLLNLTKLWLWEEAMRCKLCQSGEERKGCCKNSGAHAIISAQVPLSVHNWETYPSLIHSLLCQNQFVQIYMFVSEKINPHAGISSTRLSTSLCRIAAGNAPRDLSDLSRALPHLMKMPWSQNALGGKVILSARLLHYTARSGGWGGWARDDEPERLPLLTFCNESLLMLFDFAYPAMQDELQEDRWGNSLVNLGCRILGEESLVHTKVAQRLS